jgi:cell division protein FtsI/penicillin-binding protein 2
MINLLFVALIILFIYAFFATFYNTTVIKDKLKTMEDELVQIKNELERRKKDSKLDSDVSSKISD